MKNETVRSASWSTQNTVLAALFTFSPGVIYAHYAAAPRVWRISAIDDQAAAGLLMWVPGSLAFLLPVLWIVATVMATPESDVLTRSCGNGPETEPVRPMGRLKPE